MANIQERRNKDGKLISYSIRVHRGRGPDGKQLRPWTATFDVSPTWTEKSARKKAEAFAATFEKECREGVTTDSRQKFGPYCTYVLNLKEKTGIKHSTIVRYKELTTRIYPALGHMKLKDIRPDHLNSLYSQLAQPGAGNVHAIAKMDLAALLKEKCLTRLELSNVTGLSLKAVYAAVKGERVKKEVAEAISTALGGSLEDFFSGYQRAHFIRKDDSGVSPAHSHGVRSSAEGGACCRQCGGQSHAAEGITAGRELFPA